MDYPEVSDDVLKANGEIARFCADILERGDEQEMQRVCDATEAILKALEKKTVTT